MNLEQEVVAQVRSYLDGHQDLGELMAWFQPREWNLADLPLESVGGKLSGSLSLTDWEFRKGHRNETEAHDIIAEDFAEIVGSRALP